MQIFIAKNGQQLGPYTLEHIQGQVAAGALSPLDLAWYEGLADWAPLSQIPGYRAPEAAAAHPAFSPEPPPYRAPRPIWATVISIYLFVTVPLGLLSLLLVPLLASIPMPNGQANHAYQAITYVDYGMGALTGLISLVGAILLFLMRRAALYLFGAMLLLTVINDIRLVFFKNMAPADLPRPQAFGAMIGMSAGVAFGLMLSGAIFFYVLHLYRAKQLR
jgi:hypothetical protein